MFCRDISELRTQNFTIIQTYFLIDVYRQIEDTYKHQIAALTTEIEKERENLTTEEAGVRDRLEKEIEQYKADDIANKEKLLALQKVRDRG